MYVLFYVNVCLVMRQSRQLCCFCFLSVPMQRVSLFLGHINSAVITHTHSCPTPAPSSRPLLEDCIDKGKKEFGHLRLLVAGYMVSVKQLLHAYTQVSDVFEAHSDLL